jgi:ADP-ribosylglycohydrolase
MHAGEFELLLAVAHSLVAAQVCDVRQVASALAERCELSRRRYASPHIRQLLTWLQAPDARLDSLHWLGQLPVAAAQQHARSTMQTASSSSDRPGREPWGTADNTAAAAVPPLAVAYRAAPWPILESAVQEMCMVSHSHPIGIDGARVIAATMHWLLARASPTTPSPAYSGNSSSSSSRPGGTSSAPPPDIAALLRFLETEVAQTADMKGKLAVMRRQWVDLGHVSSWRQAFAGPQWAAVSGVAAARLSHHGLATSGTEAAVVAVWALITSWGRPAQAVCVAAALGGSVPVTTQLVGALAGAAHGDAWIPAAWIDGLENGGVSAAAADVGADGDEQQELGQEDVVRQDNQDGAIDADVEGGGLRDEVVAVAKQLACMRCSSIGLDSVSTVHQ